MGIIENTRAIADLVKKAGDVDLYRKIVDLEGEVIELTREKRGLEEENRDIKKRLALTGKMTFREPFYFQESDRVPYCAHCWEIERKAVHAVHEGKGPNRATGGWGELYACPHCKQVFCVVGAV